MMMMLAQLALGASLGAWVSGIPQNHPRVFGVYGAALEQVGERWGFGVQAETTTILPFAGVVDIYQADMGATRYWGRSGSRLRPYARAAVGLRSYRQWVSAPPGGPNEFNRSDGPYWSLGVGIRVAAGRHAAARVAVKYMQAAFTTDIPQFPSVRRDLAARFILEWVPWE